MLFALSSTFAGCGIRNDLQLPDHSQIKTIVIHQTGHLKPAFNADYRIVLRTPLNGDHLVAFEDEIVELVQIGHGNERDMLSDNSIHGFVALRYGQLSIQIIFIDHAGKRFDQWFNGIYKFDP